MNKKAKALLWKKLNDSKVQCLACNHFCVIDEGKTGFCRVRKNIGGELISLVYGKALTKTIDPIEKKPLFHFKPGSSCTSVSTFGCNFRCLFCQNYDISQEFTEKMIANQPIVSPKDIVDYTLENSVEGISYTYNEPTVFFEYALEIMKLAKKKGLYNVWVSNGYMSKETADLVMPFLDAINIDLKGNDKFYSEVCGNIRRNAVLENIKYFYNKGVHVEITNLVIPSFNDKEEDFIELCNFMASLDKDMPLHFSRFFPMYKLNYVPPTDISVLKKAEKIAKEYGLNYVYLGNLHDEENSYCKKCGNLLVRRLSYFASIEGMNANKCKKCGTKNNFIV